MRYLVTGGTGFLGRHLLARLLRHTDAEITCLVRSPQRLASRTGGLPGHERLRAVRGDLTADGLGLSDADRKSLQGVDHVVHLGAVYDMTASDAANRAANVEGTRRVIELAERIGAGCLHHVSSVAVSGDYRGRFTEADFDAGQHLGSPYHSTKFAAEALVRGQTAVPWRVYRPAIVVGDSRTGEIDKVDGPYYLLPSIDWIAKIAGTTGSLARIPVPDLGATTIVPVDYVADAMDVLIHREGLDGRAFHLVSPRPQPLVDVYNALAAAAGAPQLTRAIPDAVAAPARAVADFVGGLLGRVPEVVELRDAVITELGIPPEVLPHMTFETVFDDTDTRAALAGTDVYCPDFADYAGTLYAYWRKHLDRNRARRPGPHGQLDGRTVMITGASSGIGRETALRVAKAGGIPLLVARRGDELEKVRGEIEEAGGRASVYTCDITDADSVSELVSRVLADYDGVDMLVNNAGRSIRRSVRLSYDRFHDYERTMAINYFGAVRLTMALLPHMSRRRFGHIVNISSIGVQTNPPRFSAYLGSKAALDAFTRVVGSETFGDGITFTTIHMPLVRTPMIAPTNIYKAFPTRSPEEAADMVMEALERRPKHIGTTLGTLGSLAYTVAPRAVDAVLHVAYRVFPDSAAARGDADSAATEMSALSRGARAMARVLPGVHW
ncbi:SDR family oxidoreductase [Pseudonocardia eucalypti]|uniref:SDR family oxidoreductase n=1 Tax=Pseudonocardia eucalypti TaxID=648755 RepID=A0ABP9Q5X0_9PSEU|nr:NAD(P)-dependent dehydrogenase (short-subunit alcohol dehydrogenase family) [Pseudonocardia eucalypti]